MTEPSNPKPAENPQSTAGDDPGATAVPPEAPAETTLELGEEGIALLDALGGKVRARIEALAAAYGISPEEAFAIVPRCGFDVEEGTLRERTERPKGEP